MKQFLVFFTFSLASTLLISATVEANPGCNKCKSEEVIVELPSLGKLQGEERKSFKGKTFYAFEGVPYAAPPTGENRFRETQEVEKWTETKLVNNKTTRCIQLGYFRSSEGDYKVEGDEDCLFLNIYSPNLSEDANLDVVVFIEGAGSLSPTKPTTGPDYLIEGNVLYVSINYRVGILGFLSTEDNVVAGNMGMHDQIMALKFIKKYIKHFGGNCDSITLSEHNRAISASVHFHLLSPLSKGLFNRAISNSGTMLNPWALAENPREKAEKLVKLLKCCGSSMQENINCLRTKPAEELVAAFHAFQPWMFTPTVPFGIVVDCWAKKPALPEHPLKLIQQGKVQNVPWIVGRTNSAGLSLGADFYNDSVLAQIDSQWNKILPNLLDYNYTVKASLHDSVSQQIRDYYMCGKTVSKETYMDFIQIITDRLYVRDLVKTVKLHLEHVEECSSVQLYMFTYHGANSLFDLKVESCSEDFGAAYMDDVTYQLRNYYVDSSTTEEDREMVKLMVKMLVSFAKNGNADVGLDWPKATHEELNRLIISGPKKLKIDKEVFSNSSFWEALPIRENEKLFQFED